MKNKPTTSIPPFTTPQVAEILNVPLRRVLSFVEREYVSPSVQDASGHGTKRLWSYLDIVRCMAVKYALTGSSVDYARGIAKSLKKDDLIQPDKLWVLTYIPEYGDQDIKPPAPYIFCKISGKYRLTDHEKTFDLVTFILSHPAQLVLYFGALHEMVNQRLGS